MKLKIISFASLILLLLLTLGSVYSSDTGDNSTDECLNDIETEEIVSEPEENNDYIYGVYGYTISDDNEYDEVFRIQFNKSYDTKGNITVEIDDESYYNRTLKDEIYEYDDFELKDGAYFFSFYKKYIPKELSYGTHDLLVKQIWDSNEKILINTTFNSTYSFYAYNSYIDYGEEVKIWIFLPKDATGTLTATYNGKTKKAQYKNGKGALIIDSNELKLGETKVTVKLTEDKKYPDLTTFTKIEMAPKFTGGFLTEFYCASIGEKDYLTVKAPKSYSGTFKIYSTAPKQEYDPDEHSYYTAYYKNKLVASAKVVKGVGKIPTSKFSKGEHKLVLEFKTGKYTYVFYTNLKIAKNNPKIKVSLSSKNIYDNQKVKISVKSPKTSTIEQDMVMILDGKEKFITLKNGKATKYLSKLKPGTHTLKLYMWDNEKNLFFSKTFKIKVKSKITIKAKNLAVKKSSKKYTVKATLKIKEKLAKSKKITFKINGKTFKAKTNKKGVAKATLKKSFLKKLPIGKKIKYTVSYGKTVVSKTLRVK